MQYLVTKIRYIWLCWSSQTTYQDVNQEPSKGNSVYKGSLWNNLDPENIEGAEDLERAGSKYKVDMLFNNLMTELFESSNNEELMQSMLAKI